MVEVCVINNIIMGESIIKGSKYLLLRVLFAFFGCSSLINSEKCPLKCI